MRLATANKRRKRRERVGRAERKAARFIRWLYRLRHHLATRQETQP